jgi:hypothetical protein
MLHCPPGIGSQEHVLPPRWPHVCDVAAKLERTTGRLTQAVETVRRDVEVAEMVIADADFGEIPGLTRFRRGVQAQIDLIVHERRLG